MSDKKRVKNTLGFTLLEMVVVLAVIAILAAVLTPMIGSYVERGRLNAAKTDLKNIAASIIQFNTDTKLWPIYSGLFIDLSQTPDDVKGSPGNDAVFGGGFTAGSANGSLDDPLNRNTMGLPTVGKAAWKGAYLELSADPWGTKYYLTSKHLRAGDLFAAFVFSAGPDQTIQTSFDQLQGAGLTISGDDLVVRIK